MFAAPQVSEDVKRQNAMVKLGYADYVITSGGHECIMKNDIIISMTAEQNAAILSEIYVP